MNEVLKEKVFDCGCTFRILEDSTSFDMCEKHRKLFGEAAYIMNSSWVKSIRVPTGMETRAIEQKPTVARDLHQEGKVYIKPKPYQWREAIKKR